MLPKRSRSWETDKQAEKDRITVQYSTTTNEWRVTNKNAISGENIKANIEYGTSRINAYHILEQTLNLKDVVIKDKVLDDEGKEREVVNEEETVQRVINPNLPDDPNSKINAATQNIFDIWDKTKEDRLTQVVFCDLATPKKSIWGLDKEQQSEVKSLPLLEKVAYIGKHVIDTAKNLLQGTLPHKFNVYDDVKAKLILKGVPEEEIAFVHDYNSDKQKQKLFAKVRAGTIRVVIGSTEKMGAGTNIQDKLVALHHLDCPWRPSEKEQS